MTDVYAHILDETLKQEWLATKERINAAGRRVSLTTPVIDDDTAWPKHQLAKPNGRSRMGSAAYRSSSHALTQTPVTPVHTSSPTCATSRFFNNSSSVPSSASLTPSKPAMSGWRRSTAAT